MSEPISRRYLAGGHKNSDDRLKHASYSEVRERIQRARRMKVRDLSPEQVASRIGLIMDGYRTMVRPLELNGGFRARKNVDGKLFERTSEIWYPPASAITSRGRFNDVHEPLLYICNTGAGAAFEIRAQVGDLITLAVLRTKARFVELACAHIGLDRSNSPAFGPKEKTQIPRSHPAFQKQLQADGLTKKWIAVDNFLSDVATAVHPPQDEQHQYKITNAISRPMLAITGVHGLTYPSVATQFKNMNIALKPEVADREFEIGEVWLMKIEAQANKLPGLEESGPFFQTRFLRKSLRIDRDGRIEWSGELRDVQPEDILHLAPRQAAIEGAPWHRVLK